MSPSLTIFLGFHAWLAGTFPSMCKFSPHHVHSGVSLLVHGSIVCAKISLVYVCRSFFVACAKVLSRLSLSILYDPVTFTIIENKKKRDWRLRVKYPYIFNYIGCIYTIRGFCFLLEREGEGSFILTSQHEKSKFFLPRKVNTFFSSSNRKSKQVFLYIHHGLFSLHKYTWKILAFTLQC